MEPVLSSEYMGFLVKGILIGYEEHCKLYAYQSEPRCLILHLFCRGKSGSAMRAIAATACEQLPELRDKGFMTPLLARADDAHYLKLLGSEDSKKELVSFFLHWGLHFPAVLPALVALSENVADSRDGDSITDAFVHGRLFPELFNQFSVSLGTVPSSCVIVELCFSQMKNQSQSNQTAASRTEDLKFIFNVLRENKDERRVLVASTTSGAYRHNHTKGQLQLQAQQGRELTRERYSPDGMKHISGRRKFIGRLKAADKVTANRASQVKASKKSARPRQIEVTQAERDATQAAILASPLAVQLERAAVLAITQSQRIFAVVMDEQVTGQVNGSAVFWNSMKGGVRAFRHESTSLMPLIGVAMLTRLRHVTRLDDTKVTTLKTKGPKRIILIINDTDSKGDPRRRYEWVPIAGERPSEIKVRVPKPPDKEPKLFDKYDYEVQHGLLSTMKSLRNAFFSRESRWKHGGTPIEGEVTISGGSIQRGFACPYCKRDDRKLQHWGCVSCFLDANSRKAVGQLILMNTCSKYLLRKNSEAAKTAATREGRAWE